MIQIKFGLGDEVFYFDIAKQRVVSDTVESAHVIPVPENDGGGSIVFYQTTGGDNVPECGAFSSKDELIGHYASMFGAM